MADVVTLSNLKKPSVIPQVGGVDPSVQAQSPDAAIPPEIAAQLANPAPDLSTLPKPPQPPTPEQAASPDFEVPKSAPTSEPIPLDVPKTIAPPPPVLNAMGNSTNVDKLADIPPPGANVSIKKPGFGERVASLLPLLGMVGAAMESAGKGPFHEPIGAQMLQNSLLRNRQMELEREKMQNVDIPLAQAHANYFNEFNPTKMAIADAANYAKIKSSEINHRFVSVPQVGLFDTQDPRGPQLVPGSNPQSITITADVAKDYNLPKQMIDRTVPLQMFSSLERGGAMQNIPVQGANDQFIVNRSNKTKTPLGVGSPAVAARQAGVEDAVVNGQITPMTGAQRLAAGAPKVGSVVSVGQHENKIFEPALDADTRMKQMMEQAADPSGASDMALLFNHIAMTGGNVKGMRMGTLLTEEHMKSRSIPEELGVLWNRVVAGERLSPQQRLNFIKLAKTVRDTRWAQAYREAAVQGVGNAPAPDPDLPTVPGPSQAPATVNIPSTAPATTTPPAKPVKMIDVFGSDGTKIGTATPEQQKRGSYTPIR